MTTHTVHWFEAEDGTVFSDEMECMDYDTNILYKKSGVRFFIGDTEIDKLIFDDDRSYWEMTDIFIDRMKKDENDEFGEAIRVRYGWELVNQAIDGNGTHYSFEGGQTHEC